MGAQGSGAEVWAIANGSVARWGGWGGGRMRGNHSHSIFKGIAQGCCFSSFFFFFFFLPVTLVYRAVRELKLNWFTLVPDP